MRWWLEVVLPLEGTGLTNDPADPGGMTFMGISRRYQPDWPGWHLEGLSPEIQAVARTALAHGWYAARWDFLRCHQMRHEGLGLKIFDQSVLWGANRAVTWAQMALNDIVPVEPPLQEDGIVGPRTLAHIGLASGTDAEAAQAYMGAFAVDRHFQNDVGERRKFMAGHLRRAGKVYT